jgi:hypothetical protein
MGYPLQVWDVYAAGLGVQHITWPKPVDGDHQNWPSENRSGRQRENQTQNGAKPHHAILRGKRS